MYARCLGHSLRRSQAVQAAHVLSVRAAHILSVRAAHVLSVRAAHVLSVRAAHVLSVRAAHVLSVRAAHAAQRSKRSNRQGASPSLFAAYSAPLRARLGRKTATSCALRARLGRKTATSAALHCYHPKILLVREDFLARPKGSHGQGRQAVATQRRKFGAVPSNFLELYWVVGAAHPECAART
jgi:hypothetical protein